MGLISKFLVKKGKSLALSAATAVTINAISNILGLNDSKIVKILSVGIPMMTFMLSDDPDITDLLFKESKKKDRKKKKSKKEAEKDYFNMFGEKGKKMNKAIAEEADATEEEVNGVMSLFMPSFVDAIEEEDPEDSKALGKMFKKESDEMKKEPSLARMAMKVVF
jgi:hypothetical protein